MTEEELIRFLRIPEISKAKDFRNVVDNLIRMQDLPCIYICNTRMFPLGPILGWFEGKVGKEKRR